MILGVVAALAGGWFALTTYTAWEMYSETKKPAARTALIIQAMLAVGLLAFAVYRFVV